MFGGWGVPLVLESLELSLRPSTIKRRVLALSSLLSFVNHHKWASFEDYAAVFLEVPGELTVSWDI